MLIEIRKAGEEQNGIIGPAGMDEARDAGRALKGRKFTHLSISNELSLNQTLVALIEGARLEAGAHLVLLPMKNDEKEPVQFMQDFCMMLKMAPQTAEVLAVGQSPRIEQIVKELTGIAIPPLVPLAGVILELKGEEWSLIAEVGQQG